MSAEDLCLIDSNVLIYMFDRTAGEYQPRATQVFEYLASQRRAALSVQCLTEFFNSVTRRAWDPMQAADAAVRVERFASASTVLPMTAEIVMDATDAVTTHQMSIWDALIWSVAFHNRIVTVLTEDMQSQSVIAGIRYVNPFAADFDLNSL